MFVPGTDERYIDVSKTIFKVKGKMLKQNAAGGWEHSNAASANMGPVNNVLWALFAQVHVMFNGTLVQSLSTVVPYLAFTSTRLHYGKEAKVTQFALLVYDKDALVDSDDICHAENKGTERKQNRTD